MLSVAALLEREGTGISWADFTFNPWLGCSKVSPACDFCYAEKFVEGRLGHMGVRWDGARKRTSPGNWQRPTRWNAVAAAAGVMLDVFTASLADWADKRAPEGARPDLGALILRTPNLRWKLLTKRIGLAERYLREMFPAGVPGNVALGITVCNQKEADRDIPRAIEVKRRLGVRWLFLSMEPLLGAVEFRQEWLDHIDLVIVGGESGKHARPTHPGWAVALQAQCYLAGVRFHFKQWGEWFPVTRLATPAAGGGIETRRIASATMFGRTYRGKAIHHFPDDQPVVRVGTKLAGRMLLGKEHLERLAA